MLYSKEQIERANSRNISEFFRGLGYSADYESGEMHIHGFGGLKVNENTCKLLADGVKCFLSRSYENGFRRRTSKLT